MLKSLVDRINEDDSRCGIIFNWGEVVLAEDYSVIISIFPSASCLSAWQGEEI